MVRLIVQHQDVFLAANIAPEHTLQQSRIALHIPRRLHKHFFQRTCFRVGLRVDHRQQSARDLPLILFQRQVSLISSRRGFRPNPYCFPCPHQDAALLNLRSVGLYALRLKDVPVCDQHPALRELGHHALRHQVAGAVDARISPLRL